MRNVSSLLDILHTANRQGFTEHIYKPENANYWHCNGQELEVAEIVRSILLYDESDQRIIVLYISANGGLLKGVAVENG